MCRPLYWISVRLVPEAFSLIDTGQQLLIRKLVEVLYWIEVVYMLQLSTEHRALRRLLPEIRIQCPNPYPFRCHLLSFLLFPLP